KGLHRIAYQALSSAGEVECAGIVVAWFAREMEKRFWIAELIVLAGAWLCYTVRLTTSELIIGLAAIALSVWLTHLVWSLRPLQALFRWELLREGWPIP